MPHSAYTCSTTLVHQEAVEKAAAHMPDSGKLEKTASYFRLLGDPTRVRILWALHTCELCVCDLCAVLGMEKSPRRRHHRAVSLPQIFRLPPSEQGRTPLYRHRLRQIRRHRFQYSSGNDCQDQEREHCRRTQTHIPVFDVCALLRKSCQRRPQGSGRGGKGNVGCGHLQQFPEIFTMLEQPVPFQHVHHGQTDIRRILRMAFPYTRRGRKETAHRREIRLSEKGVRIHGRKAAERIPVLEARKNDAGSRALVQ